MVLDWHDYCLFSALQGTRHRSANAKVAQPRTPR
jgi:hypothetical protein